jgi:hypothetical protein
MGEKAYFRPFEASAAFSLGFPEPSAKSPGWQKRAAARNAIVP